MRIAARLALATPMMTPGDARQVPRVEVELGTTLRTLGYHGRNVVLRDISAQGFMAESEFDFPAGAPVRLKVPGLGIVLGRIVWSQGGRVGGAFVTPIDDCRLGRALGLRAHAAAMREGVAVA